MAEDVAPPGRWRRVDGAVLDLAAVELAEYVAVLHQGGGGVRVKRVFVSSRSFSGWSRALQPSAAVMPGVTVSACRLGISTVAPSPP
jgi:hypothetical protein